MIFPSLKNKAFGYVNLNTEAGEWTTKNGITEDDNKLLDPTTCDAMVKDVHAKYSLDFSYGGWMEDRSFLWRRSYLEQEKTFMHLGVDLNVEAGTEVAADFDAEVVKVDSDYPEVGGWGTRVILKYSNEPIYMIYAHLDPKVLCKVGDHVFKDQIFAKVGKAPFNGNWFSHLHVQTISSDCYKELEEKSSWSDLDGYGHMDETALNAQKFRDPMEFISLK